MSATSLYLFSLQAACPHICTAAIRYKNINSTESNLGQSISSSSTVTKVYPCFVKVSITSRAASTEVGYTS